jgi:hypothetical protein
MKKYAALLLIFIFMLGAGHGFAADTVVPLPDVLRPQWIDVDDNNLYVTEGINVYIYSLKDFKLKKKFGKKGEGPQEFLEIPGEPLIPYARTKDLMIFSVGKVSFFSKEGVYKREMKTGGPKLRILPFGDGYVGLGFVNYKGLLHRTIHLYDSKLTKTKELARMELEVQKTGPIKILDNSFFYDVYDNMVFVAGKKEFVIDVFDGEGKPLHSITHDFKNPEFTKVHKQQFLHYYSINPRTKNEFQMLKHRLEFPGHFPAVAFMWATGGKLYVMTWKEKTVGSREYAFLVFDVKGKFLKEVYRPVGFEGLSPDNITIYNGKLYQLIENTDEDQYELHITDF